MDTPIKLSILFLLFTACGGSEESTTAGPAAATAGGDDLSFTAMAKKVENKGQGTAQTTTPAVKKPIELLKTPPVPQLAAVSVEGDQTGPSAWGAPEQEAGTPLPQRPKLNSKAQDLYNDGVQAARAGQLDQAKTAFQGAVNADSKAYEAEYNLGVIADRQGNPDEALQHYQRALRIQPDYEAAVQGTVNITLRRGSPQQAVQFVEPIANQWQRNLYLQAIYADTLVRADRVDEAERVARRALARDERFVPAILALAKASERRGRKELAETTLDQAKEIDPNNPEVHFLQAKNYQRKGELALAIASYRKAIELNPDYAEARMALGIQFMASGNYNEALQQFEIVVRLVPTLVPAHLNLGDAYRALKRWQEAKAEFDKALRMQTQLPEAHYNLGVMYMAAGAQFPGMTELDALNAALSELNTYRSQVGPKLPPNDQSAAHMTDIQRRIDREKKRIEREKAKAEKDAQRKAREGAK
ncbi:MAG TPA: tetratricopeptide repeat protein [Polyangiales bacterium]|nr:tetratricopeptide repeat protein [Polyangiales bacterium]